MKISEVKAIITGGSSGIGKEIAKVLREQNASVLICGRDEEKLKSTAKELDVYYVQADVSKEEDVVRLVNHAISLWGSFNVLINNAAYGNFSPLVDIDLTNFEALMAVNVTGAMLVGRECAKHFMANQYGNIVNIASTAGLNGFAGGTAYVASKFALKGMTECWRAELRKSNIRVMLVNPSEVQTSFYEASGLGLRDYNASKLQASEIAHTVKAMLEMNDNGFITEATVFATNPK